MLLPACEASQFEDLRSGPRIEHGSPAGTDNSVGVPWPAVREDCFTICGSEITTHFGLCFALAAGLDEHPASRAAASSADILSAATGRWCSASAGELRQRRSARVSFLQSFFSLHLSSSRVLEIQWLRACAHLSVSVRRAARTTAPLPRAFGPRRNFACTCAWVRA